MSNVKLAFGTAADATITLASLADGASRESTAIDNSSNLYIDYQVTLKYKLVAGTPTGQVSIGYYATLDGSEYTGGATGVDADYATGFAAHGFNGYYAWFNFQPMQSNTQIKVGPFWLSDIIGGSGNAGFVPQKFGFWIHNASGFAFTGTAGDHGIKYQGVYATIL